MTTVPFDFAAGQKTITALAIMMIPAIAVSFGYIIEPESISSIIAESFKIIGQLGVIYGLACKVFRNSKGFWLKIKKSFKHG